MNARKPRLLVLSGLFPSDVQPLAGLFIRERMFRLGRRLPITVVAPQPWFPLQGVIRAFKPGYRPQAAAHERQGEIEVFRPRFASLPGIGRRLDGAAMAVGCFPAVRRLRGTPGFDIIDAHFAYPDGYAATRLGKWLNVPVTITLRGTEIPLSRIPARRKRIVQALHDATRIFSVSNSLKEHAVSLGIPAAKIEVIGNGVDIGTFHPVDRAQARRKLGIPASAKILISVGALVERKGFHRVIELLPRLKLRYPDLHYLVVGGGSPEGNLRDRLEAQVSAAGLNACVHFLGATPPADLRWPLSAANVFVLATRNEGWANVFLEAMACGLPVITTDVGGNAEVVCRPELGAIVPFGDEPAMLAALDDALRRSWDRERIVQYARANAWDVRIEQLEAAFMRLAEESAKRANGGVAANLPSGLTSVQE
jgi:glycosyltransferase involved in cell wall biosynthesis